MLIDRPAPPEGARESASALAPARFPVAFDAAEYRAIHADLTELGDEELAEHYAAYGRDEGRRADVLASRDDFAALIPDDVDALEIGPYFSPMLRGPKTKYFDVRSQAEMVERAHVEGYDGATVPYIHYASPTADLGIVGERFDAILSSHCIEHQPDLIRHLQSVESLLRDGGCYFVIVPDKRYCFDHFIPESTLAGVIQAHHERRTVHVLSSVLEHRVLMTHNDCIRHWDGDHGEYMEDCVARTRGALAEYESAAGDYIDVHAWYLTPHGAELLFPALHGLRYTSFQLERLYPTRRNALEFWMILRKTAT